MGRGRARPAVVPLVAAGTAATGGGQTCLKCCSSLRLGGQRWAPQQPAVVMEAARRQALAVMPWALQQQEAQAQGPQAC